MSTSNIAVLTKSHNIIASKKRARREQVKEVLFDDDARREFLTGFHKRKVLKQEAAKKKAIEREKQERLDARREKRQMLAEKASQNAKEVEKAYGATVDDDSDDEWDGVGGSSQRDAAEHEEQYEDEEQLATVTVVEDFDPDTLLHGEPVARPAQSEDAEPGQHQKSTPTKKDPPRIRKTHAKVAEKAKKIKYETNAARKAERSKQQKRKTEKAQRAGGKGSRKSGSGRGKR